MTERRITTEMVAADLAAVIGQWRKDSDVDTADLIDPLARLLTALPCGRPAHALLRGALANESWGRLAEHALNEDARRDADGFEEEIKVALREMARALCPAEGTPWRTIVAFYGGWHGDAEPDPLVELKRRLDEGWSRYNADAMADDESWTSEIEDRRQAELYEIEDAIGAAKAVTAAGAAAQLRLVLGHMEGEHLGEPPPMIRCHIGCLSSALAFLGESAAKDT